MSEQISAIEHRVLLDESTYANTVGPSDVIIGEMYPEGLRDERDIYVTEPWTDANGYQLTGFNSVLRFKEQPDNRLAISGNTKTGICAVAKDCGQCVLANTGLSLARMSEINCAVANTARGFELADVVDSKDRFMLLPAIPKNYTGPEYYVVDDDSFTPEYNNGELLQNRLKPAMAVVFKRSWLEARGHQALATAINGADGSGGVATVELEDDALFIPFCSMRPNMGDREEKDQIIRQALNAYFDAEGYSEEQRQQVIATAPISISLSASADLPNFGHKIQVPSETEDAPKGQREYAAKIRQMYPDLIERAGGKITSAIVLEEQFRGAFSRGHIFPEFEAKAQKRMIEMGLPIEPLTPDNCPGNGQTCNVAYREETKHALTVQLQQMGVPEANIHYDDSHALDPGDPSNKMASNRAEQNNGVAVVMTNRTLNGIVIQLPGKTISEV